MRSLKKIKEEIYKKIEEDVSTSGQLLRLRLAFNYFLGKEYFGSEEDYMKEWEKMYQLIMNQSILLVT